MGYTLFHVEDEIEHASCNPETYEMEEFVIQRQGVREIRESKESQDQHDDERERDEPLPRTYSASERTWEGARVSLVVGGSAYHKLVFGSGVNASRPSWPCGECVAHCWMSGQQTIPP